jgi:hypothetical protein
MRRAHDLGTCLTRYIRRSIAAIDQARLVFVLRANTDTGFERHPNSHQRMVTLAGTGDMKTDAKGMPNDVKDESEIVGQSNVLVSDAGATLQRRWISIPKNVWHRPVIPKGTDWLVVSFHTVPPMNCSGTARRKTDVV